MAKGVRFSLAELDIMLSTYKRLVSTTPRMQIYEELAAVFEHKYHALSIGAAIQRYQPTTQVAEMILKKGAVRLASRIVRRANVAEAVDVLSRPNIGVLDPIKKSEGSTGFVLSVSADSCGAVKVGVAFGAQREQSQLAPPPPDHAESDVIITSHRVEEVTHANEDGQISPPRPPGLYEQALQRSRARLEAAKNADGVVRTHRPRSQPRQHQGDGGVQGADGHTREEEVAP